MEFGIQNSIDTSVYNHFEDGFLAAGIGGGGVKGTFMSAYPSEDTIKTLVSVSDYTGGSELVLPVVSLESVSPQIIPVQLGSVGGRMQVVFGMSIFAENKIQLNSLIDTFYDLYVVSGIAYNDYTDYDSPVSKGTFKVDVENLTVYKVHTLDASTLNNSAEISFSVSDN